MKDQADHPVTAEFPVHWGELDAFGHVNNARYFTWMESARIQLFQCVGLSTGQPVTVGPILAHAECSFVSPVGFPAMVRVGVGVLSLGNTSFKLGYRVLEGRHLKATGTSVVVMYDYVGKHKVPLSPALRTALESLLVPSED